MKISYDAAVDAAYISFRERPVQVTTIRITDEVAVDLGPNEEVVGIEMLEASRLLSFDPSGPVVELENIVVAQRYR